jgi:hypothetical protein
MLQKIKTLILTAAAALMMGAPALVPAVAHADIKDNLCKGTNLATGEGGTGCDTNGDNADLGDIAAKIVNLLSIVVGVVAVIMIIFGGFRYITSGGDSGNVSTAKNTLIYAIVGLIIVALAQFIVHFVLNNVNAS